MIRSKVILLIKAEAEPRHTANMTGRLLR